MASSVSDIIGLSTYSEFISEEDALRIIDFIDEKEWLSGENALKRRTQHYGYEYDYKTRSTGMKVAKPIPGVMMGLCTKLVEMKIFPQIPDQLIVNEYLPGQGIAAHIDQPVIFGDTITSIALCGDCTITFGKCKTKVDLHFKERMAVVLQNDARYQWTHSIPARKSDKIDGVKIPRKRRISLTFRTIKNLKKV